MSYSARRKTKGYNFRNALRVLAIIILGALPLALAKADTDAARSWLEWDGGTTLAFVSLLVSLIQFGFTVYQDFRKEKFQELTEKVRREARTALARRLANEVVDENVAAAYDRIFTEINVQGASARKTEPKISTTAVAALMSEKVKQKQVATPLLLLGLLGYVCISALADVNLMMPVVWCLVVAAILLEVSQIALEYRVRHALYGTNEYEARQLIGFILKHAEDIDFSDGLGIHEIEIDGEMSRILQENWGLAT